MNQEEIDLELQQKEADKQEILRIHRIISPTGGDMQSIYNLYKKYVDPTARPYSTNGCQTCGNSIVNYWRGLTAWYRDNQNKF